MFDMRRREFISLLGAGAAAAWPRAASAQRTGTIARLGYLSTANPRSAPFFRAFEQRLRDLGYIDGENIIIEYRNVEGDVDKLPELVADPGPSRRECDRHSHRSGNTRRHASDHDDPYSHGCD
jgi:hypothetical protein